MGLQGVLLVNLGTPDSPAVRDVRRYLREFLTDPLVIDLPAPARWLLLHAVILPFRPRRSAAAYAAIWTEAGSPLLVHSGAFAASLAETLGAGFVVELAMRYGRPAVAPALVRMASAGVTDLIVLPLFPQHAASSSGSAIEHVRAECVRVGGLPEPHVLGPFFGEPAFVGALAEVSRERLRAFDADHVLLSFHGLPERHVLSADPSGAHCLTREDCCSDPEAVGWCYRAQCFATARAFATTAGLASERTSVAFQSRLGRTPWIQPYLDDRLVELAAAGVRRLAVLCPSFVADCLESLEEIGMRGRERWSELGGTDFALVPCLNSHPAWVACAAEWVRGLASPEARRLASPEARQHRG
jgi:ferrochelatase